jgi:asparagine synthetase B (glutamine-hydrolysing)
MFDIFLTADFRPTSREKKHIQYFHKLQSYSDIYYTERVVSIKQAQVIYLERNEEDQNYIYSVGHHIFMYGSIFTNKYFQEITGELPTKVDPLKLSELYLQKGDKIVNYLKGSFIIIIVNEDPFFVKLITDKLNVLPLYYFYKDQFLIISSNVRLIISTGLPSKKLNQLALLEQILFGFMLDDNYFLQEIYQTKNAAIHVFEETRKSTLSYWSVEELYHEKFLPKNLSFNLLCEQMVENVNLYSSDANKILFGLTGGYDSSLNLALIQKPIKDICFFSWGIPHSKQINIPQEIALRLNLNYQSILLDQTFDEEYEVNAVDSIEFSNGTAPITRAPLPFTYKKLRNVSELLLTGLFGSEILRPLNGILLNNSSEKIFLGENVFESLKRELKIIKEKGYLYDNIYNNSKDLLINHLKINFLEKYKNYDKLTRFFFFIIQEGIRKFFMQEMQIDRVFVTTRCPYSDDDFLELIYQTVFSGLHISVVNKNKINSMIQRYKCQHIYGHLIHRYSPLLCEIYLSHGTRFINNNLPSPFYFINFITGQLLLKLYNRKNKTNDTFDSSRWTSKMFEAILSEDLIYPFNHDNMTNSFRNKLYKTDHLAFAHALSISRYLSSV